MTRFQLAFDDFDNTQCSANLFRRETNIWKQEDICPTPDTYDIYNTRGKRQSSPRKECKNRDGTRRGCTTKNTNASIDVRYCKRSNAYNPENILRRRMGLCCLSSNFRALAINQITRQAGSQREGRANFMKTKDVCCNRYRRIAKGVDALKNIRCKYSS